MKLLLLIMISSALLAACKSNDLVAPPSAPEWQKIGEVYNYSWPRLRKDFSRSHIEARIITGYPISELWVKTEQAHLCEAAVAGWRKSSAGFWWRNYRD